MPRPHSAVRPRPALISAAPRSVSGAGAAAPSPAGLAGAGGGGNCTLPTSTPNCRGAGARRLDGCLMMMVVTQGKEGSHMAARQAYATPAATHSIRASRAAPLNPTQALLLLGK